MSTALTRTTTSPFDPSRVQCAQAVSSSCARCARQTRVRPAPMAEDTVPVHDRAQPFPVGHTLSMQSGARSPRTVGPLAEQIERDARADPSWPAWLSDSSYAPAVAAWAHAEARCVLLRR